MIGTIVIALVPTIWKWSQYKGNHDDDYLVGFGIVRLLGFWNATQNQNHSTPQKLLTIYMFFVMQAPTVLRITLSFLLQAGKIFSFGGVTSIENNTRSKSVYSFWAVIPSLRDICWEALNHYCPHLVMTNKRSFLFVKDVQWGSEKCNVSSPAFRLSII